MVPRVKLVSVSDPDTPLLPLHEPVAVQLLASMLDQVRVTLSVGSTVSALVVSETIGGCTALIVTVY